LSGLILALDKAAGMTDRQDLDFRRLFESLPSPYLVLAPDLTVVCANSAFLRALAVQRDQVVGRRLHDAPHEDIAAEAARALADSLAQIASTGRAHVSGVWRRTAHHPDGTVEERDWITTSTPILGDRGEVRWIVQQLEDVTGAHGADEDRERLASIVTSSHDAIIGKTLHGVVTSWNRAAEETFGFAADEILGQHIGVLFPPDRLAEEDEILARLKRGERVDHYETVRRRKDGQDIQVSLSVSPIRNDRGEVVGASKIVRDITRQKQVQERMDELQSELLHVSRLNEMGQMASAFAHELNQPLSAIGNYIHGVRRLIDAGDFTRAAEGCQRAADQVTRVAEVIRRLRDFVKKDKGSQQLEALAPVIEAASALAQVAARSEGVKFTHRFSPEAASAVIDKVQAQQVIVNLVRNAIEATAGFPRREIVIATEPAGEGMVEIAVSDTGAGISPDVRERLFQPFVTTKAAGMGVGLSLCRTIVEAHGGRIWADDLPGGGSVFRFTVPAATSASRPDVVAVS